MKQHIMRDKRGQARGIDLMAAMILFLLVMTQMTVFTIQQISDSRSQSVAQTQEKAAIAIAEGLLSTSGNPENWETLNALTLPADFILGLKGPRPSEADAGKIGRLFFEAPPNWALTYSTITMNGQQVFSDWDIAIRFFTPIQVKITSASFPNGAATTIDVAGTASLYGQPLSGQTVQLMALGSPGLAQAILTVTTTTTALGTFTATLNSATQDKYVVIAFVEYTPQLQGFDYFAVTRPNGIATAPIEVKSIVTNSPNNPTNPFPYAFSIVDDAVPSVNVMSHISVYQNKTTLISRDYTGTYIATASEWRGEFPIADTGLIIVVNLGRNVDTTAGTDEILSYSVRSFPQPIDDRHLTPLQPAATSLSEFTFTRTIVSRGILLYMEVKIWEK